MKALLFERSLPRFAASRLVSELGSGRGAKVAPLRLVDADAPELPGAGWHRVAPLLSGICGSDLATLDGRSSRYFEPLVSFPFVPGHEVVGTVEAPTASADGTVLDAGSRVVIQPVLGCVARGIEPPCRSCAAGHTGDCEHVAFGHIAPGIQTGFCADTGGGWSAAGLVAHESQIFAVPDALSDADAVTVEPVACALHAVLGAGVHDDDVVAVFGAGTLGLATLAALTHLASAGLVPRPKAVLIGARYANQRALASELGATAALSAEQLSRAVRRHSRSMTMSGADGARLTGGADVVFDCVGSADSIGQSLEMVRPRGTIVLVGMPGKVSIDLAPLWHREIRLAGAYAYGTEAVGAEKRSTFSLAIDTVEAMRTGRLVSATYPLDRFEEAVAHAGAAGRRGAVKIAFDLRATSKGGRR
jgi:threonine dehydrogenase-like Zn-dependent dehydrogenase